MSVLFATREFGGEFYLYYSRVRETSFLCVSASSWDEFSLCARELGASLLFATREFEGRVFSVCPRVGGRVCFLLPASLEDEFSLCYPRVWGEFPLYYPRVRGKFFSLLPASSVVQLAIVSNDLRGRPSRLQ